VIGAKGLGRFDDIPSEFFVLQKVEGFDEPQFFPVGQFPKLCTPLILFIGPRLSASNLQGLSMACLTFQSSKGRAV
jgi:hypothetical protein